MTDMPKYVPLLGRKNFTFNWGEDDRRCSLSWISRVFGIQGGFSEDYNSSVGVRDVTRVWHKQAEKHYDTAARDLMYMDPFRCNRPNFQHVPDNIPLINDRLIGDTEKLAQIWRDTWEELGYFEQDGKLWRADCEPTVSRLARELMSGVTLTTRVQVECEEQTCEPQDVKEPVFKEQPAEPQFTTMYDLGINCTYTCTPAPAQFYATNHTVTCSTA